MRKLDLYSKTVFFKNPDCFFIAYVGSYAIWLFLFYQSKFLNAVSPLLKRGLGGFLGLYVVIPIKEISFAYIAINIILFENIRFILLLKHKAEIPLNPPFMKGGELTNSDLL